MWSAVSSRCGSESRDPTEDPRSIRLLGGAPVWNRWIGKSLFGEAGWAGMAGGVFARVFGHNGPQDLLEALAALFQRVHLGCKCKDLITDCSHSLVSEFVRSSVVLEWELRHPGIPAGERSSPGIWPNCVWCIRWNIGLFTVPLKSSRLPFSCPVFAYILHSTIHDSTIRRLNGSTVSTIESPRSPCYPPPQCTTK